MRSFNAVLSRLENPTLLDKLCKWSLLTIYHWHLLPLDLNGFRLSLKFSSTGAFFVVLGISMQDSKSEERKRLCLTR